MGKITNSTFTGISNQALTISKSEFKENRTLNFTIKNVTFTGNNGAIIITLEIGNVRDILSTVCVINSLFVNNSRYRGAAISSKTLRWLNVLNSTFIGNEALRGGAI